MRFLTYYILHTIYQSKRFFEEKKSFTLYELLITVSILAIVVTTASINLIGYKSRHSFELDSENIVNVIRNTQDRAVLGEGGASWGVVFMNNELENDYMEIFSGSTYASSTVVLHEALSSVSNFQAPVDGASTTIIFSALSGAPSASTTVSIVNTLQGGSYAISINGQGAITRTYTAP